MSHTQFRSAKSLQEALPRATSIPDSYHVEQLNIALLCERQALMVNGLFPPTPSSCQVSMARYQQAPDCTSHRVAIWTSWSRRQINEAHPFELQRGGPELEGGRRRRPTGSVCLPPSWAIFSSLLAVLIRAGGYIGTLIRPLSTTATCRIRCSSNPRGLLAYRLSSTLGTGGEFFFLARSVAVLSYLPDGHVTSSLGHAMPAHYAARGGRRQ